jgi:hypothetical protein
VDLAALATFLQGEHLVVVQNIIAHHEAQRRRLCTAGQMLRDVRTEVFDLRVHAEGLGGRVERVLSDTIRTIIDGDESLTALGQSFAPGIEDNGGTHDSNVNSRDRDEYHPIEREEPPVLQEASAPAGAEMPADNIDREFERRRRDEMSDQFHGRYKRHMRTINTTHNSWVRNLNRDRPPHEPRGMVESIPQIPGDNDGLTQPTQELRPQTDLMDRSDVASAVRPEGHIHQQSRVQFDSISTAPRGRSINGPQDISQYRVTSGPAESGLWNAEHYHHDVMLSKVRRNVEWKVGSPISAPTGTKHPKISEPSKYSGNRSHDNFCNWLDQFLKTDGT